MAARAAPQPLQGWLAEPFCRLAAGSSCARRASSIHSKFSRLSRGVGRTSVRNAPARTCRGSSGPALCAAMISAAAANAGAWSGGAPHVALTRARNCGRDVVFPVLIRALVADVLHRRHQLWRPFVEGAGANLGDVHSQAAVDSLRRDRITACSRRAPPTLPSAPNSLCI